MNQVFFAIALTTCLGLVGCASEPATAPAPSLTGTTDATQEPAPSAVAISPWGSFVGMVEIPGVQWAYAGIVPSNLATTSDGKQFFVPKTDYIGNGRRDEVLTVDSETLEVVATTGVLPGYGVQALAASGDGTKLYVGLFDKVLEVNPRDGTVLNRWNGGNFFSDTDLEGLVRMGKSLYAGTSAWGEIHGQVAQISTVNLQSFRQQRSGYSSIVGTCPKTREIGMFSRLEDGQEGQAIFMRVTTKPFKIAQKTKLGRDLQTLAVSPDCSSVITRPENDGEAIKAFSTTTGKQLAATTKAALGFEVGTLNMVFSPDGSRVYAPVVTPESKIALAVLDPITLEVKAEIVGEAAPAYRGTRTIRISDDGSHAFVAISTGNEDDDDNVIVVFRLNPGE